MWYTDLQINIFLITLQGNKNVCVSNIYLTKNKSLWKTISKFSLIKIQIYVKYTETNNRKMKK